MAGLSTGPGPKAIGLPPLDVLDAIGDAIADFQEGRALTHPAPALQRPYAKAQPPREFVLAEVVQHCDGFRWLTLLP